MTRLNIERFDTNNYVIRRQTKDGIEYLTNQLKLVILEQVTIDNTDVLFGDKSTCINLLYCYVNDLSLDIPTTNHCWDWSDDQSKYDNLCPWLQNDGGAFYCNLGFKQGLLIEQGTVIIKAQKCNEVSCNGTLD